MPAPYALPDILLLPVAEKLSVLPAPVPELLELEDELLLVSIESDLLTEDPVVPLTELLVPIEPD